MTANRQFHSQERGIKWVVAYLPLRHPGLVWSIVKSWSRSLVMKRNDIWNPFGLIQSSAFVIISKMLKTWKWRLSSPKGSRISKGMLVCAWPHVQVRLTWWQRLIGKNPGRHVISCLLHITRNLGFLQLGNGVYREGSLLLHQFDIRKMLRIQRSKNKPSADKLLMECWKSETIMPSNHPERL